MTQSYKPHFLMCRPEHFGVTYAINPWMDPKSWARDDRALASASHKEWERLHRTMLDLGAKIDLVPAVPNLPDLVFTANAAVVMDGKALVAHFRHPERQAEEPHYNAAFRAIKERGMLHSVDRLPENIVLEGAGDCVWDPIRNHFWMGYGPRSNAAAQHVVKDHFGLDVVALELADSRFYHMDTALRPLPGGEVLYYPNAFTTAGRSIIRDRVPADDRIEIKFFDARRLAANAVSIGGNLLLSDCSSRLQDILSERGYRVVRTPLKSFLRSGGSAFCLTLQLDHQSAVQRATSRDMAALARIA